MPGRRQEHAAQNNLLAVFELAALGAKPGESRFGFGNLLFQRALLHKGPLRGLFQHAGRRACVGRRVGP